jgi:hypothetical protein
MATVHGVAAQVTVIVTVVPLLDPLPPIVAAGTTESTSEPQALALAAFSASPLSNARQ